eukprot:TRINITY_DN9329_c0_g1_i1.p1 TRINITY_DN9329_c0_g1~~TRINITY_DN9329_c0_g1_i1.p1  ORF type:complete len:534 (-),score=82.45 TRINITY_DN9329_c0_g1_i1:186-1787(-)
MSLPRASSALHQLSCSRYLVRPCLGNHRAWASAPPPPPASPPPTPSSSSGLSEHPPQGSSTKSQQASPVFVANASALQLSRRLVEIAHQQNSTDGADREEASRLCEALGRRLKAESSTFRANDVVQLAAAACKIGQQHPPLLESIAAHVLRGMVAYPLYALCNIANNMARLGYRNRQFLDALAVFVAEPVRAEQLSAVDIATLTFAYAQLLHRPRGGLLEACAERLQQVHLEVGGPNCAIILNSYSRLGECNPLVFGVLSKSVVQTKPESFQVHHISLIMNAYAKCQVRKPQMMHVLSDYLTGRVSEMSPQNVSNVVHAVARLDCYNHKLFHSLLRRVSSEDLSAYKLYELGVLSHSLAKLKAGGQVVHSALFKELAARPAEIWEPKAVAQVLDALRRRSAFCHEPLLGLLFRRFFDRVQDYAVHPLTQASWCLVELDALDLAAALPWESQRDEHHQGDPAARYAMRQVLERLEELNTRQPFTPTQRCHVQQLIRAYHYRHELDYSLQPQKVKSFCKTQFDVSTSMVSAVAWA